MDSKLLPSRLQHIDIMRAIAILFMIEVHAAATFQPSNVSLQHPFALFAAMIGGLAAPLFVTISGWGTHRSLQRRYSEKSEGVVRWIMIRVTVLIFCQLLVNLISPHLFDWHTPGVLSLLALCGILSLITSQLSIRVRLFLLTLISVSPFIIADYFTVNLSWSLRISSNDFSVWISRLFVSGTYPLFPWLSFFILGGLINDLANESRIKMGAVLSLFSIIILVYAFTNKLTWALTSGDALLTFFPTSTAFVITAMTGVLLIHEILIFSNKWNEESIYYRGLTHMGSLSLTIYVLHFIPFTIYKLSDFDVDFDMLQSFLIILSYTFMWWFLAILHLKNCKEISIEYLLRKLSN